MITRAVLFEEFAGRHEELDFLVSFRARSAQAARGGTVLVSGDGGVGKTRLLVEFAKAVESERGRCTFVRCDEASARPYGPLIEALESLREARELRGSHLIEAALAALTTAAAVVVEDAAEQRLQRIAALRRAFEYAAPRLAHLTLIVDDGHQSDLASLDALRSLTAISKGLPLTIVLAYRGDDVETDLTRSKALAAIEREGADRIVLLPLTRQALTRPLRALLPNARPGTVKRIYELSEGKPYVAEELARSVVEGGGDADVAPSLSLRTAVLSRVARLDPAFRDILRRAAVLGKVIRVDDLIADGIAPSDVLDTIRAARNLQLVEERQLDGDAAFRFRHAITQEILYSDLLGMERREMHLAIADRLELQSPERLAEIAYHLDASGAKQRAAVASEAAGDRASAVAAFGDAVKLYARALGAIDAAHTSDLVRVAEKFLGSLDSSGELEEQYATFSRICTRVDAAGLKVEAFGLRARALMIFATYQSTRATTMLPSVREHVPDGVPARVRFDAAIAVVHALVLESRFEEAVAALAEAEAAAPDPDNVQKGKILVGKTVLAYHWYADFAAAEEYIRASYALAHVTNDSKRIANSTKNLSVIATERGEYREAIRLLDVSSATFAQAGYERWASKAECVGAMLRSQLGDFSAATRVVARTDSDASAEREWILCRAHLVRALGGDRSGLVAAFDEAVRLHNTVLVHHLLPDLVWSAPTKDEARAILRAALAVAPKVDNDMDVAGAVAAFGNDEDVAAIKRQLSSLELRETQVFARAGRHLVEARIAQREHRPIAAVAAAKDAVSLFAPMGLWAQHAQALVLAGEPARARELLRAVGATAELERLGTAVEERTVEAVAVTQREEQVARLAAMGLANREIALKLVVSVRTVEAHLTNVYEKLSINSREELAEHFPPLVTTGRETARHLGGVPGRTDL